MFDYPKASGRRLSYAIGESDDSKHKKENITIACTAYLKEGVYQLCKSEDLVISQLGERIFSQLLDIKESLGEKSLIHFLYNVQWELDQLQEQLQTEKEANLLLRDKLAATEAGKKRVTEAKDIHQQELADYKSKYGKHLSLLDRGQANEGILRKLYAIYGESQISREVLEKEGFDFEITFGLVEVKKYTCYKLFHYGYRQLNNHRYLLYQFKQD